MVGQLADQGPAQGVQAGLVRALAGGEHERARRLYQAVTVATACGMVDVVLTTSGDSGASLLNLLAVVACTLVLDLALIPAHGVARGGRGLVGRRTRKEPAPPWQPHRRYGLRPFGRPHPGGAPRTRLGGGMTGPPVLVTDLPRSGASWAGKMPLPEATWRTSTSRSTRNTRPAAALGC